MEPSSCDLGGETSLLDNGGVESCLLPLPLDNGGGESHLLPLPCDDAGGEGVSLLLRLPLDMGGGEGGSPLLDTSGGEGESPLLPSPFDTDEDMPPLDNGGDMPPPVLLLRHGEFTDPKLLECDECCPEADFTLECFVLPLLPVEPALADREELLVMLACNLSRLNGAIQGNTFQVNVDSPMPLPTDPSSPHWS